MTIPKELLDELEQRRRAAAVRRRRDRLAERRARGQRTARERLALLFDDDTFQEWGMHVEHACRDFGMDKKSLPCDGVVTGVGRIDGRPAAAFSQDGTVGGGALGQRHAKKICDIMDYALEVGMPLVAINDSGGARIQEAVESLSGYGQVFYRNVLLSGCVPQIGVIAGNCAGGAAYSPALMDFLIMTREHANMFICGPQVIKAATGVDCTMDEIGSAAVNAEISGNVHFVAESDEHAMQLTNDLLSYLPGNNVENPPHRPASDICLDPDESMNRIVPDDAKEPINMYDVIAPHGRSRLLPGSASGVCSQHHRRIRACRWCGGGSDCQSADGQSRHAGHRRFGQRGPFHPFLQRLQYPPPDAGGRARISYLGWRRSREASSATGPRCCLRILRRRFRRSP